MQPFTLRRRGPVLRPVPATGSTLPAYIFEAIRKPSPTRSVSNSRSRPAFSCLAGYDQRLQPVARVNFRTPRLSSNRHSPPGHFYPSGSKPSVRLHSGMLAFRVARSSFAPRLAKYLTITARRIKVPDPLLPVKLAGPVAPGKSPFRNTARLLSETSPRSGRELLAELNADPRSGLAAFSRPPSGSPCGDPSGFPPSCLTALRRGSARRALPWLSQP
jgi:hypothetical protein